MNKQKTKQKRQSLAERLVGGSLIIGLLMRFADFLYNGLGKSLCGTIFTAYDRVCHAADTCFAKGILTGFDAGQYIRALKFFINRQFERSVILGLVMKTLKKLLDFPLRQYGVFFFTYGVYSFVLYCASLLIDSVDALSEMNFYFGAITMVVTFPALFSKKTVAEYITTSVFCDLMLFKVLGLRREKLVVGTPEKGWTSVAFLLGTVLGVTTTFVNVLWVPIALAALVGAVMLITTPETGVLLIFFALPFLPTMVLAALIIAVTLCWMLKLIRGKRTLRLEPVDFSIAFFMLLMFFGGLVSAAGTTSLKSALVYCCFIFSYFLVVGMLRTREWVMRCVGAMVSGAFFVALLGIYENFFGAAQSTWHDAGMFEDITGRVVSTFENPNVLAEYLIMILPFVLSLFLMKTRIQYRSLALVFGGALGLCLIFTWSRGAWLGMLFGVAVYFLIYSRRTMLVFTAGLFALPFLPFVLPQSIVDRFLSIGDLKDTSTNYRVNIWRAVVNMVDEYFGSGIGVGTAAFGEVYPKYSLAAIESAPHSHNLYLQILVETGIVGLLAFAAVVILVMQCCFTLYKRLGRHDAPSDIDTVQQLRLLSSAGLCGIFAMLVQGMTDHVWYNYRVFCMFWLIIGLTMAVKRAADTAIFEKPIPDTYVDLYYGEGVRNK